MKAIFVHDHKFHFSLDGHVYTDGKFPYVVWQRYLKFFNELVVVGRAIPFDGYEVESHGGLNLSSGPRVSFAFMPNIAHPWRLLRYGPRVAAKLKALIASADAVIIRTSLLGRIAAYVAEQSGKPWALEVVGCSWDALWNYGNLYGRLYAPFAYLGLKVLARKSPYTVYVTRHFLQKRYPCRGETAAVSDVEVTENAAEVLERRLEHIAAPGSPFIFGLIGSLNSKYKGIQTAIAALRRVSDQLPSFELRILGGGDSAPWERLAITHGIAHRVNFLGTLPGGDPVLHWLDTVDVYLQPSFTEGLPRALVEAMSRGCPAVGSTAGGIGELLPPEALHSPGDVEGLGNLILKAIHPTWRRIHAVKNFSKARDYSKEVVDARRDAFWQPFAEYVRSRKGFRR